MDDLLTPVSTTYLKSRKEIEPLFTEVKTSSPQPEPRKTTTISTVDDAVDALKNQPDYDSLIAVLQFLTNTKPSSDNFSLSRPNPKSALIIHLLVSEIAPNYWTLLLEGSFDGVAQSAAVLPRDAELFVACIQSLTGLNAVLTQIRTLIQESRMGGKEEKRSDLSLNANVLLSVLSAVLGGHGAISAIWSASTKGIPDAALQRVQSQKLASILTNGQIVSTSAEALEIIGRDRERDENKWIADGLQYSRWIGNSIVSWIRSSPEESAMTFASELFQKSLSLHHSGKLHDILGTNMLTDAYRYPYQNCY
jgi:telomere length regulation protein